MTNRHQWQGILTFFAKAAAVYGLWYVIYDLWLQPLGSFDETVSLSVAAVAGEILSWSGLDVLVNGRDIWLTQHVGVRVVDGCNGITTIGLFIGFVIAYPGDVWRRLVFIPLGIVVLYASNVVRVMMLLVMKEHWVGGFDVLHGLGAPAFFYLIVMGLWVVWANYGSRQAAPTPVLSRS